MYIRLSDKITPNVDQEDEDSIKLSSDCAPYAICRRPGSDEPKTGWGVVIPKYFTNTKEDAIFVCVELIPSEGKLDPPKYLMVPISGHVRIRKPISKGYFLKYHEVYNSKD